jgi:hypothetical protein
MKLDLDSREVFEAEMTVEQIREMSGEGLPNDVFTKLDEAQGFVFTDEGPTSYLVIKITK